MQMTYLFMVSDLRSFIEKTPERTGQQKKMLQREITTSLNVQVYDPRSRF